MTEPNRKERERPKAVQFMLLLSGSRGWVVALWTISVISALLFRLAVVDLFPGSLIHEDSLPYIAAAERLLQGLPLTTHASSPGYPILLAGLSFLSRDLMVVAIAQHVLGVATILILCRCLALGAIALPFQYLTFLVLGFNPLLIYYDSLVMTECLATFCMALACLGVASVAAGRWNILAGMTVSGGAIGFAATIRPATLALIPIFLLLAAASISPSRRGPLRNLPSFAVWVAAFLLIWSGIRTVVPTLSVPAPTSMTSAVMSNFVSIAAPVRVDDPDPDRAAFAALAIDAREKLRAAQGQDRFARVELQRFHMLENDLLEHMAHNCRNLLAVTSVPDDQADESPRKLGQACSDVIESKNTLLRNVMREALLDPSALARFASQASGQFSALMLGLGMTTKLTVHPNAYASTPDLQRFAQFRISQRQPGSLLNSFGSWPLVGRCIGVLHGLVYRHYAGHHYAGLIAIGDPDLRFAAGAGTVAAALILLFGLVFRRSDEADRATRIAMTGTVAPLAAVTLLNAGVVSLTLYALNRYAYYVLPFAVAATCAALSIVAAALPFAADKGDKVRAAWPWRRPSPAQQLIAVAGLAVLVLGVQFERGRQGSNEANVLLASVEKAKADLKSSSNIQISSNQKNLVVDISDVSPRTCRAFVGPASKLSGLERLGTSTFARDERLPAAVTSDLCFAGANVIRLVFSAAK